MKIAFAGAAITTTVSASVAVAIPTALLGAKFILAIDTAHGASTQQVTFTLKS